MKRKDKRQTILVSAGRKIVHQSHNRALAVQFQRGFGEGAEASVVIDAEEIFGREAWLVTVDGQERFISFRRKEAVDFADELDRIAKQRYGILATVTKRRLYLASNRRIDPSVLVQDDDDLEENFLPDDFDDDAEGGTL